MNSGDVTRVPLFPLDLVLVPGLVLPLHIFELRYRALLADVTAKNPMQPEFGIVAVDPSVTDPTLGGIHRVGTSARITEVENLPDGRSNITVVGQHRFEVLEVFDDLSYLTADVRWLAEDTEQAAASPGARQLAVRAAELFKRYRLEISDVDENEEALADAGDDPHLLSYILTAAPMLPTRERQQLLATDTTDARLTRICDILRRELRVMKVLPSVPWSSDGNYPSGS